MGEAGVPHCVFVRLAYRPAISAGKGGGNRARRAIQLAAHVRREASLDWCKKPPALCLLDHLRYAQNAARGGQALEPGAAGEVIAAGQHGRRRRHKPYLHAQYRPFGKAFRVGIERQIDPHLDRLAIFVACRQHQAHPVLRRLFDPLEHAALDLLGQRAFKRLGADHGGACPDQAHAARIGEANGHKGGQDPVIGLVPPEHGERAKGKEQPRTNAENPLPGRIEHEPAGYSCGQRDRNPWSAVEARLLKELLQMHGDTGQSEALSPRRVLQRNIGLFSAQRNQGCLACRHGGIGQETQQDGKQ